MRQEEKLKEKVGSKLPYTVPEGYFKSFKENLMQNLPEYPEKPVSKPLSRWQRLKPYVYLAAMFAGIWCMMQIFHRVSSDQPQAQNAVAVVTESVAEPDAYDLYIDSSTGADIQFEDDIISLYPSIDEFKHDFYAQL